MEKYSVLMSLYAKEHPEYLRQALDSMINQTIPPDEIVLVEDGPLTEELNGVVEEYRTRYPELMHIVINDKNLGLGLALNKGLLACRNELVARMDTDDISRLDRCEQQLSFLNANQEVAIVGGQIEEFIESPNTVVGRRTVPISDFDIKQYLKKRCPFNHMSVMFRKALIVKVGNYRDWFWNEDYDLWIRLADENVFANLPEILVDVRVGKDMYKRRGGMRYFKSEFGIQQFMLKKGLIGYRLFAYNCVIRLVAEVLLPSFVRGWIFKKFARN